MKKVSLAELMGKQAANGISLKQLPDILGDAMPELPRNAVGRFRLITALQQRFGDNYRVLPGVSNIVKEFDDEVALNGKIAKIAAIKLSNFKREK